MIGDPSWTSLDTSLSGWKRSEHTARGDDDAKVSEEKLRELSHEFEAILTAQILESLSLSMAEPSPFGEGGDAHGSKLDGLMWLEMARQLTSQRDLGLASSLYQQLAPTETAATPNLSDDAGPSEWISRPLGAEVDSRAPAIPVATPGRIPPSAFHPSSVEPDGHEPSHRQPELVPTPTGQTEDARERHVPVSSPRVSSPYGRRMDPIDGTPRNHRGVDWAAPMGETVRAASAGEVVFSGPRGGYGNTVIIEHEGGVQTLYAHLSELNVRAGQHLSAGAPVGAVGQSGRATGPHLHFEVRQAGGATNPVAWLEAADDAASS